MPRPKFFGSSPTKDWISPLIVVANGLVSFGNCVPFPYVNAALSSGLALLQLIQAVRKSTDDLQYLAESVTTIMKLLREEMESHGTTDDTKFRRICAEFELHLARLSKDLEVMSKDWSSSKLKRYLKSNGIRDEITQFTTRVHDLRANATLSAAIGTRMDLMTVANSVANIQVEVTQIRRGSSTTATDAILNQELVQFEKDFHALKLGDIQLNFKSARTSEFGRTKWGSLQESQIGWTDYRANVKGVVRTVRVYQGSEPTETFKEFLFHLADHSPSPHLPQLFGFCSSHRLKALVFHEEFLPLDEYARELQSSKAIVEWEMDLVSAFLQLQKSQRHKYQLSWARKFALVNPQDGNLIISHVEWRANFSATACPYFIKYGAYPYMHWFVGSDVGKWRRGTISRCDRIQLGEILQCVETLGRWDDYSHRFGMGLHDRLTSKGCVYVRGSGVRVAQLETSQQISPDDSWDITLVRAMDPENPHAPFPPRSFFPILGESAKGGWTHFVVPLVGSTQRWFSLLDHQLHCGYSFAASIGFGTSVPDISRCWLSQANSIMSTTMARSIVTKASDFFIPTETELHLTWEMIYVPRDNVTPEQSLTIQAGLPKNIHVFVQVPIVTDSRVATPDVYWSSSVDTVETAIAPPGTFKIGVYWQKVVDGVSWEQHHYDVVKSAQEQAGFDPATNAAAVSFGLPLLKMVQPNSSNDSGLDPLENWSTFSFKHPHSIEVD